MGVIVGGWEYIIAVYMLTGLTIIVFFLWIMRNHRSHLQVLARIEKQGVLRRSSGCSKSI